MWCLICQITHALKSLDSKYWDDSVIVNMGVNDLRSTSLDYMKKHKTELLDSASQAGVSLAVSRILLSPRMMPQYEQISMDFNNCLRFWCHSKWVQYLSAWEDMTDRSHYFARDGWHLSPLRFRILAKILSTPILPFSSNANQLHLPT